MLTPDLRRRAVAPTKGLERPYGHDAHPPVVGYDHRVFLLLNERALAFDAAGRTLWDRRVDDLVGGGVTTDGQLLIATRMELVAIDPAGTPRTLWRSERSEITGPPLLSSDGTIYVVTADALVALEAGSGLDSADE